MPHRIDRGDPTRTDWAAGNERDLARLARRLRDGVRPPVPMVESAPPLQACCDGCGLSASAFYSIGELDEHRRLCEHRP